MRISVPLVIGRSPTTIAQADADTRRKESVASIALPAHQSGKKHHGDTTIKPLAAKQILVNLEANEGEAIHKGKYLVTK